MSYIGNATIVQGGGTGGTTITIADDTTTNATRHVVFSAATSGTATTLNTSGSNLTFNPSTGDLGAVGFNTTSDERLKENIQPITDALNVVDLLEGKTYQFIASGKKSSGVIAQELFDVLPDLVTEDEQGYLSVSYMGIVPYLIEAIKELRKEVELLKGGQ